MSNPSPLIAELRRLLADWDSFDWENAPVELRHQFTALLDRLEELERVVGKLPKTADGVPIVPGMKVWHWFECPPGWYEIEVVDVTADQCSCEINEGESSGWYDVRDADTLYSKEQAAMPANLDNRRVQLYDPHPGLMGCLAPLPGTVRALAKSLDGKTRRLDEVMSQISDAAGGKPYFTEAHEQCVALYDGKDFSRRVNCWRVLRFKELPHEH